MSKTKPTRRMGTVDGLTDLLERIEQYLRERNYSEERLLTIDEVATKLQISTRSIEKEIAAGRLNPLYVRSQRRFTQEMVERYLDTYCRKPKN